MVVERCLIFQFHSIVTDGIVFASSSHNNVSSNGISASASGFNTAPRPANLRRSISNDGQAVIPTARARQDAQVHIFTAALLEHLCSLYEPRPEKQKWIYEGEV